jgi:microcystin-dependent protein
MRGEAMGRVERAFLRMLMAAFLIACLSGAALGPSRMIQVLFGAGNPLPGEVVPRQIPYRGYVEQNGTALTAAGVPMRFRLYGLDGGVLHEETQNSVVVQQGHFSVELGDGTAFGPDVMRQNFLELEVGIGSPPQVLLGRQRILAVPFAQSAASGVPAGTVVAFAGETIPAGWLLCDGSNISTTQYPTLCVAIGTSWGTAPSGQCKLPDLRGQFLRAAHGPNVDPDGDRSVGSSQASALRAHSHAVTDPGHTHFIAWGTACGCGGVNNDLSRAPVWANNPAISSGGAQTGISVQPSGEAETRPGNLAVNYLIKF